MAPLVHERPTTISDTEPTGGRATNKQSQQQSSEPAETTEYLMQQHQQFNNHKQLSRQPTAMGQGSLTNLNSYVIFRQCLVTIF